MGPSQAKTLVRSHGRVVAALPLPHQESIEVSKVSLKDPSLRHRIASTVLRSAYIFLYPKSASLTCAYTNSPRGHLLPLMATRKSHNKTRLGCGQCKKRRIKVCCQRFASSARPSVSWRMTGTKRADQSQQIPQGTARTQLHRGRAVYGL